MSWIGAANTGCLIASVSAVCSLKHVQFNFAFPKNWSGFKTPFSFSIRLLAAHGLLLLFCLLLLNATSLVQTHLEKNRCSISICAFSVPTTACPAYSPCGKQITVQQSNKLTRFSPSIDPKFAHVRTCLSWCSYAAWSRGAVRGMVIPLKIGFNRHLVRGIYTYLHYFVAYCPYRD